MQSKERLLTPLLKYFVLALAHGILGTISEETDDVALQMLCAVRPCH